MGCGKISNGKNLPSTRPSCLDCVEKHLGAAMVQLSEMREGYKYRLLIIGHLHEAGDESQQWPELHNLIRAMRKAFQRHGAIPDFDTIGKVVEKIRQTGKNPIANLPKESP